MPNACLEVLIPLSQSTSDQLIERGFTIKETTDDGYIVEMTARNRYRGDDETVIYYLANDPDLEGIDGWKVIWANSSY